MNILNPAQQLECPVPETTLPARASADGMGQTTLALRASGLTRTFGKANAVNNLDLSVRTGEIYGFLGTNGAGKTTTIRMLMGIIKPDAGTIELLGERTQRTSIRQKQSIGYVSQEQTFYPWMTARGLGHFVGGFYPTWEVAEFERLLRVLDVPPDRRVSQLSGGMRVKLALALALAPRPALLLLDEPTSGLDPLARREFLDIIQRQARVYHRTTFFSSHIIGEVERVADRVGIIHRGQMQYEGDLESLRASVRLLRFEAKAPPVSAPPPPVPAAAGLADGGAPTCRESANVPPLVREDALPHEPCASKPEFPSLSPEADLSQLTPAAPVSIPAPPVISPVQIAMLPESPAFGVPEGFLVLRDETAEGVRSLVLRAAPGAWDSFRPPASAELSALSLEDIFIALVGNPAAVI